MKPFWFPAGDSGILLDFLGFSPLKKNYSITNDTKKNISKLVSSLSKHFQNLKADNKLIGISDIVPGLASILFHYDSQILSSVEVKQMIELEMIFYKNNKIKKSRLWKIPVLYGGKFGPDLENIAKIKNLTVNQIIKKHTSKRLEIIIMGFLPGLGYMSGLDADLELPRRLNPRISVPKGSVGIAIGQTVIYPLNSPGGWNLIGRTPINLFDPTKNDPILFRPGDFVDFYSINEEEFNYINKLNSNESNLYKSQEIIK